MTTPEPTKTRPEKLRKYPHMGPKDILIWERFLDETALPNALVAYDVHVGSTPILKPTDPEWLRKHIQAVYPKKLDAVLYYPDQTLVIEIKPFAGLTAIGQALGGCALFKRDFPSAPTPRATIITDRPQPDIPYLCTLFSIILLTNLSNP